MIHTEEVKEIFYFNPLDFGYNPKSIHSVHLAGEFNDWGQEIQKLDDYKLIKDKTDRWVGVFNVPKGKGFYKFLLNKNTYAPDLKLLSYSTTSTPGWAKKAVWYQIMTDRFYKGDKSVKTPNLIPWESPPDYFNNFGGNLKGIKDKIPYLKSLFGSLEDKALYLNPISESSASNHKYWPESFEKIDPQFGTEEDLKNLADVLHNEGAKIIIDLVYNHTGLNHHFFRDILKKGPNSKYYHWYRKLPHLPGEKIEIPVLENYSGDKPQNVEIKDDYIEVWSGKYKFPIVNPEKFKNASVEEILNGQPYYRLVHVQNRPNYKCWVHFFEMPELNTKNPELKEYLFNAAKKWLKLGVDGFRLDVPDVLVDSYAFWKDFREEMAKELALNNKNPDDLYIMGEIWTGEILGYTYLYGDNKGKPERFDSLMSYSIREAVLNFVSGEILNKATDRVMRTGEITVSQLDNSLHKMFSSISWETSLAQYNALSSHDARRIRTVFNDDKQLKAVTIMHFTLPGASAIYYGDEIGMTGGADPQNRASMMWDIVEDLPHHKKEAGIFNLYKELIILRESHSCFTEGFVLTLLIDDDRKIYAYARYKNCNDFALVIISRDKLQEELNLDISNLPFANITSWKDPLTGKEYMNYGKNIIIKPADMQESFGLILLPVE
jgi:cyclomaltodextrinase / maltogenic alpha-amylase / neopullulanase